MGSLEFNKIAASVLVAGIVALVSGVFADALFHPDETTRGYSVEVVEGGPTTAVEIAELDIKELLIQADSEAGKKVAKKCASCHEFKQGTPHRVGPNLYGVVGAKKAHHNDYPYSKAMVSAGGAWDVEALNEYLKKPAAYIKGTKMAFAGIKDPKDRANLICYMQSLQN